MINEIKAEALMRAYNKKYSPKVSLDDVKHHLHTHAYRNMTPEFAATIMHKQLYELCG